MIAYPRLSPIAKLALLSGILLAPDHSLASACTFSGESPGTLSNDGLTYTCGDNQCEHGDFTNCANIVCSGTDSCFDVTVLDSNAVSNPNLTCSGLVSCGDVTMKTYMGDIVCSGAEACAQNFAIDAGAESLTCSKVWACDDSEPSGSIPVVDCSTANTCETMFLNSDDTCLDCHERSCDYSSCGFLNGAECPIGRSGPGCAIRYGERIRLNNQFDQIDYQWLVARLNGNHQIWCLPINEESPYYSTRDDWTRDDEEFFEWQILAAPGDGTRSTDEELDASAQCVKYGDVVYIQSMSADNKWISGSRGSNNGFTSMINYWDEADDSDLEAGFQWTVRSESGSGDRSDVDPRAGECVHMYDSLYFQNMGVDDRWLTGSRSWRNYYTFTRSVISEDDVASSYAWTITTH